MPEPRVVAGVDHHDAETSAAGADDEAGDTASIGNPDQATDAPVDDLPGSVLPEGAGPVLEWTEANSDAAIVPGAMVWSGTAFIAIAGDERGSRLVTDHEQLIGPLPEPRSTAEC